VLLAACFCCSSAWSPTTGGTSPCSGIRPTIRWPISWARRARGFPSSFFSAWGSARYLLPLWFLGFGIVLIFHGVEHAKAKLTWAALLMLSLACLLPTQPRFDGSPHRRPEPRRPRRHSRPDAHLVPGGRPPGPGGTTIALFAVFLAAAVLFFGWDAILREGSRLAGILARRPKDGGGSKATVKPRIGPARRPPSRNGKRDRLERVAAQAGGNDSDAGEPRQREMVEVVAPCPSRPETRNRSRHSSSRRPRPNRRQNPGSGRPRRTAPRPARFPAAPINCRPCPSWPTFRRPTSASFGATPKPRAA